MPLYLCLDVLSENVGFGEKSTALPNDELAATGSNGSAAACA